MVDQTVGSKRTLTQTAAVEAQPRTARLLYIDNIRTMLITFVILLHMAITYGAQGDWYYKEPGETSTIVFAIITFVAAIGGAFVLGLFFLLAGYFTPHAYDRKGFGLFLVDRLKRLLIPLAFYEILINPFINYAIDVHKEPQGSVWQYLVVHFNSLESYADGPVWFLLALMVFSLFYALWRYAANPDSQVPKEGSTADKTPDNWKIALFAFAIGLATFLTRLWFPVGFIFEPWNQELAHYPQYIAMFAVGTIAYRRAWLAKFSDSQARTWRWVALACILLLPALVIAAGVLSGKLDERGAGGWNWLSFSYSMWEGFMGVAMVIVTLAWFRKRFNHQGWLARKMAEATFTAYVLHPGIIIPLALLMSGISMNLGLKFILVAPLAVALTYLLSYYFRRLPLIRNVF